MVDHTKFIRDGIEELQKQYVVRDEAALTETLEGAPDQVAGRLWQVTKTGVWLTVQQLTVNGTELGAQEWRDDLFLRYGLDPRT